jgi:hypothetical protein
MNDVKGDDSMRISIPFSYRVTAIPFKHKQPSNLSMVENAWVEVPEVDAAALELALVVRDTHGRDIERVYALGGEFWVKDSRDETDMPFVGQHLRASGRSTPETRSAHRHEIERAKGELDASIALLGKIGMLRTRSADIGTYEAKQWLYTTPAGFEFVEKTVESERARNMTVSTREERLNRARKLALEQSICVDGQLFHRVPEPVIASGRYGNTMSWRFGCPDFLTEEGISKNGGYPVSAKDFDKIHDWFDTDRQEASLDFSFHVVDDRHFKIRADRIGLMSAVQRAITDGLSNKNSTDYIEKWCAMRDTFETIWKGSGPQRMPAATMLEQHEAEFDNLAGWLESLAACGETRKYGGELDLQGLKMWDSRAVALSPARNVMKP